MHLLEFVAVYTAERDIARSTANYYRYAANCFCRWAVRDDLPLDDAARLLNVYVAELCDGNRFTAKAHRSALTVLLRAASLRGLCQVGTMRPVRIPQHAPNAFTPGELSALLLLADPLQRAAIRLAYDTGYRHSDLFALLWSQVCAGPRVVHTARKTGRRETRRLRPETLAALAEVRQSGDVRLLPAPYATTGWHRRWRNLGHAAGVDVRRRGLQAIRRLGATAAAGAGQSPSAYLGHSPTSPGLATQFYLDPRQLDDSPPLPPQLVAG